MQLAAATRSTSKRGRPVGRAPGGDIGRLPVVAVVDDEDAVREAIASGPAGFFRKPFDDEALLSIIHHTLDEHD